MEGKPTPLQVSDISWEGAILNAIKEADIANKKIVKLGLPDHVQKEIISKMKHSDRVVYGFLRLKSIYGIKVVKSKTLQITTEFSRFKLVSL